MLLNSINCFTDKQAVKKPIINTKHTPPPFITGGTIEIWSWFSKEVLHPYSIR